MSDREVGTVALLSALSSTPSDINEHVLTLYELALQCSAVLELGMRYGVSTRALLCAQPEILYTVENNPIEFDVEAVEKMAKLLETEWVFINWDSREVCVRIREMLFV